MTELEITIPGPEIESDPEAVTLWDETGIFISAALAQMHRDKALSVILGRLQHELREAYGAAGDHGHDDVGRELPPSAARLPPAAIPFGCKSGRSAGPKTTSPESPADR